MVQAGLDGSDGFVAFDGARGGTTRALLLLISAEAR